MTPQEALNILDEIAQDYPLKWKQQQVVRRAVAVLQDAIAPPRPQPEPEDAE